MIKINKKTLFFLLFYFILLIINSLLFTLGGLSYLGLMFFISESIFFQWIIPLILLKNKTVDIFSPFIIFLFFYQFFYLIHPIIIVLYGPTLEISKYVFTIKTAVKMFYYINTALLSFYLGYFILQEKGLTNKRKTNNISNMEYHIGKNLSLVFVMIGFIGFYLIIKSNPFYYIMHLSKRVFYIRGHGFLFMLSFFTPIGILMYFYYSSINNKVVSFKTWFFTFAFLFIYLIEGSRGHVFVILLALIIYYNNFIKKIKLKKLIFFVFILFLFFFSFHKFRSIFISTEKGKNISFETRSLISVMFFSTEQFVNILINPPNKRFYGRDYLQPFIIFIPKCFFKNKPNYSVVSFYNNYFFPENKEYGITFGPGLLGSSLLNFGFAGLVFEFFIFGLFLKRLSYRMLKSGDKKFLIYVVSTSSLTFFSVSRNISSAISMTLFFLIPLFLFLLFFEIIIFTISRKEKK